MKVTIINGPNLNMLDKREEMFYGTESFDSILKKLRESFPELEIDYYQSNIEGEIVNKLQSLRDSDCRGVVINPAAYSHYSLAILDAMQILEIPIVEVHFSNIHARGKLREESVTARGAVGVIAGLGAEGYRLALSWLQRYPMRKIGFGRS